MLYYIFRYLNDAYDVPGAGMWGYISTRSIAALILSLLISTWFGNSFINYMKRHNKVEMQRDAETDPFNTGKVGVPTMGGVIIILATLVPSLLFGRLRNIYMLMMLFSLTWLGLLGFLDDYLKARTKAYNRLPSWLKRISEFHGTSQAYREKNKNGMRPIYKLLGQFILGLGVGLVLWLSPDALIHEGGQLIKSTFTTLPFVKDHNLDYAGFFGFLGSWQQAAGWAFFVLVATFVVMAVSNGSNLNDGLDGMCAGNSALMLVAFGALAYFSSHAIWADYFDIMFIPGSQELVVFISAFVGALVGFLWFNTYPAQIFMGDTGSLAIGGTMGVIAMIIHKELLIPVICFVFLAESVSVLLQTNYAKYGNRKGLKLRMFMRSPIHDSFRITPKLAESMTQQGIDISRIPFKWIRGCMHENRITVRFWIVTLLMAAFAIMTLKIR